MSMRYIAFILTLITTTALAQTTAVPTSQITTAASDATAIANAATSLAAQQKKLGRPTTASSITAIATQATSLAKYILAWNVHGTAPPSSGMVYPFPNALNTGILINGVIKSGAVANLPAYSGPATITVNGTTISGYTISSALTINANNVTISNNYFPISGSDNFLCIVNNGTGTIISHNEFNGTTSPGVAGAGDCIVGSTMTVEYNNIYGYAKSLYVAGGGVIAIGNYFWLTGAGAGTEHQEQTYINGDDTMTIGTFTGNTMVDKTSNANPIAGPIFLASQNGTTSNIVVENNLLVGGGYPLFWDSSTAHPRDNCTITGNTLGVGQYGGYSFQDVESSSFGTGNVWSGNIDLLTGAIAAGDGSGNTTPNTTITLASFLSQGNSTEPAFTIDSSTFAQYVATAAVITLTGATKAGDGVTIYDGASSIGSATANGTTGIFTFTTGTLAAGVHIFTAVDTTSPMTSAKFYVLIP